MKKTSSFLHAYLLLFFTVSCASEPMIKFQESTDNSPNKIAEVFNTIKTSEPEKTFDNDNGTEIEVHYSSNPVTYPSPSATVKSVSTGNSNTSVNVNSEPQSTKTVTPSTQKNSSPVPTPTPTTTIITETSNAGIPSLGVNASLNGKRPFPDDNSWNKKINNEPVDPNSDILINSIGKTTGLHPDFGADWDGGPFGIPYMVVSGNTPKVPIQFEYNEESDPGPYPIPVNAPIEGGIESDGDRHVIIIDRDNWKLYETYSTYSDGNGYKAGSGAIFDLNSNAVRPSGWTSADAAGLAIFPGLVRYDEVVEQKEINHAIRFTVSKTRKAYVYPASHFASSNTSSSLPPMGMRVRLKSSFDISTYSENVQVILKAMKTYGMILADNGSNWYFSGAPDSRWNDDELSTLKKITGNNFEVVKMDKLVTE